MRTSAIGSTDDVARGGRARPPIRDSCAAGDAYA